MLLTSAPRHATGRGGRCCPLSASLRQADGCWIGRPVHRHADAGRNPEKFIQKNLSNGNKNTDICLYPKFI
jgi:hypothetical protein